MSGDKLPLAKRFEDLKCPNVYGNSYSSVARQEFVRLTMRLIESLLVIVDYLSTVGNEQR